MDLYLIQLKMIDEFAEKAATNLWVLQHHSLIVFTGYQVYYQDAYFTVVIRKLGQNSPPFATNTNADHN